MKKHIFSCTQEVLYIVCFMAWGFCRKAIDAFKALSPKYNDTFVSEQEDLVRAAKALNSQTQRNTERKNARQALEKATKVCRQNWQKLKRFIIAAFPKDEQQTAFEAAGAAFYSKASANNWVAAQSMLDNANKFIQDNMGKLTANNVMPPDFADKFKTDGENCANLARTYYDLDVEISIETGKKVDANNAIYKALSEMCGDGQRIFTEDKKLKQQFIFSHLVKVVKGSGISGFKGFIGTADKTPVVGAIVRSLNGKYEGITDKEGRFHITKMVGATYTFIFEKEGFETIEKSITIKAGVTKNIDLVLTPAITEEVLKVA